MNDTLRPFDLHPIQTAEPLCYFFHMDRKHINILKFNQDESTFFFDPLFKKKT